MFLGKIESEPVLRHLKEEVADGVALPAIKRTGTGEGKRLIQKKANRKSRRAMIQLSILSYVRSVGA